MNAPFNDDRRYDWEKITPSGATRVEANLPSADVIEELAAHAIWRLPEPGMATRNFEPMTREWFVYLENKRYRRHGQWIPKLLETSRHKGERIVGLGDTLGLEWAMYAELGAHMTICEEKQEMLNLHKKHFLTRDLPGQFVQCPLQHLGLPADGSDVVCLMYHDVPDKFLEIVSEAWRVLRPGGKIIAVFPAYYNSARWKRIVFPWRRFWRNDEMDHQLSKREARDVFHEFENVKVYKRQLRRSELPHVWRWLPLPVLERMMGNFLVVKAFKSLQVAPRAQAAA